MTCSAPEARAASSARCGSASVRVPRETVRLASALNGKRTGSWSTQPTRACNDSASMSSTSTPSQRTVPPSRGSYSPARSRAQVDLPEPLTPTNATV